MVLIVDDSSLTREHLRSLFQQCGYKVVAEADNGLSAIDSYLRYKPDLTTLDVYMPELNGLQAAQEILKYDPQAKVLVITSSLSQKIRHESEEIGVQALIVKPVTLNALKEALERMVALERGISNG